MKGRLSPQSRSYVVIWLIYRGRILEDEQSGPKRGLGDTARFNFRPFSYPIGSSRCAGPATRRNALAPMSPDDVAFGWNDLVNLADDDDEFRFCIAPL